MKKSILIFASISFALFSCAKKEQVVPQPQQTTVTNTTKVHDTLYVTTKGDTLLKKKVDSLNAIIKKGSVVTRVDTLKIADTIYQAPKNSTLLGTWQVEGITYTNPGWTKGQQDDRYSSGNQRFVIMENLIVNNSPSIPTWIIDRNSWAPDRFSYFKFTYVSGDFAGYITTTATVAELSVGRVVITWINNATTARMTLTRITSLR